MKTTDTGISESVRNTRWLWKAILLVASLFLPVYSGAEAFRVPLAPQGIKAEVDALCRRGEFKIHGEEGDSQLLVVYDAENGCYRFILRKDRNCAGQVTQWFPGFNIEAQILCSVDSVLGKPQRTLIYNYTLRNLKTSKLPLHSVALECDVDIDTTSAPSKDWYGRTIKRQEGARRFVSWHCYREPTLGILPDKEEHGFIIESVRLPTVLSCWAQGYTKYDVFSEEEPAYEVERLIRTEYFDNSVSGRTVGPSNRTEAASWDRMREFLKESRNQHWITEDASKRTADLIAEAEKAEQGQDKQLYRTALQHLLDTVTALYTPEEKEMTSEAYALFFFHTEARLDLINERDRTP